MFESKTRRGSLASFVKEHPHANSTTRQINSFIIWEALVRKHLLHGPNAKWLPLPIGQKDDLLRHLMASFLGFRVTLLLRVGGGDLLGDVMAALLGDAVTLGLLVVPISHL